MAGRWQIEGPKVLDIGEEGERVRSLTVAVIGGHVDVVTHDDSPTARIEVSRLSGLPLGVSWDGTAVKIVQGRTALPALSGGNVLDGLRRFVSSAGDSSVVLSISVPRDVRLSVTTAGASAVVSGLRRRVRATTATGSLTLSDVTGGVTVTTMSGTVEASDLAGSLTLQSVSGSITVESSTCPTATINTVSGDVALDLTDPTSSVTSNSVAGDVTIRLPLRGYDVSASSMSGEAVVDGSAVTGHGERSGRVRSGEPDLTVRASSVSGNLVVLRSTTGASPVAPASDGDDVGNGPQDAPLDEPPGTPQDAPVQGDGTDRR